jgi:lipopolysaccharide biosynthesis glycosyltransferase
MTEAAFYCVADARYFLGAAGMINSLRLQGHTEPIYLLDLGLREEQRRLLDPEVTFVAAPPGSRPWLSKTIAPLARPAETMVLIDADILVTRPLDELLERAARGRVLAFRNDVERHFEEWGDLLDLGPVRRAPYVC